MFDTLISTSDLAGNIKNPEWVLVDCRYVLTDKTKGEQNYLESHIKNALYADLAHDLSDTIIPGVTSRHPWPTVEQAARYFSSIGINQNVQVVVYDDIGGALAAVRLWWMLRWLGHNAVAVLDGGWQKWIAEALPVEKEIRKPTPRSFTARPRPELLVSMQQVDAMRLDERYRVLDARTSDRYRGENEFIDPIAGHIPGAVSAPYVFNMNKDLTFRSVDALQKHYRNILGDIPAENAAIYCGSGVTSIHNALAMLHAGMGEARIYAGSWSEWITNPNNPIATNEQ